MTKRSDLDVATELLRTLATVAPPAFSTNTWEPAKRNHRGRGKKGLKKKHRRAMKKDSRRKNR